MSDKINIAIVGLGFGAEFIPIYQRHPNTNMYAICQRTENRLNAIGDAFGITKRYTSFDDLIKDPGVDAVHINSPIHMHASQSIAALEAGKHVACTVPMATSIEECRQSSTKATTSFNASPPAMAPRSATIFAAIVDCHCDASTSSAALPSSTLRRSLVIAPTAFQVNAGKRTRVCTPTISNRNFTALGRVRRSARDRSSRSGSARWRVGVRGRNGLHRYDL